MKQQAAMLAVEMPNVLLAHCWDATPAVSMVDSMVDQLVACWAEL